MAIESKPSRRAEGPQPEARRLEAFRPEAKTLEMPKPEAKKPEMTMPQTARPETKRPEAKQPEAKKLDIKRPEGRSSSRKPPEGRPSGKSQGRPEISRPSFKEAAGSKPAKWEAPSGYIKHSFEANNRPFEVSKVTSDQYLKRIERKTNSELEKSASSLKRHSDLHKNKISFPEDHYPGFASKPYAYRSNVIKGWKKEVKAAENQMVTLAYEIDKRKTRGQK